jgi:hypothetical protein
VNIFASLSYHDCWSKAGVRMLTLSRSLLYSRPHSIYDSLPLARDRPRHLLLPCLRVPSFARLPFPSLAQLMSLTHRLSFAATPQPHTHFSFLTSKPSLDNTTTTTTLPSHSLRLSLITDNAQEDTSSSQLARAAGPPLLTISAENSSTALQNALPPRLTTCSPLRVSAPTAQEVTGKRFEPSQNVSPISPQFHFGGLSANLNSQPRMTT